MTTNTDWRNLYNQSWKGLITDEAFAHPAKFSRALIEKIYNHLLEEGLIKPGDRVLDPFGGVGLGGFHAMQRGLRWTGIELEAHFHIMGQGYDCPGFTCKDWRRLQQRGKKWVKLGLCPECAARLDVDRKALPIEEFFGKRFRFIPSQKPHRYMGNLETWRAKYPQLPGSARLLRGDSRKLLELVGGADAAVSSPPFQTQNEGGGLSKLMRGEETNYQDITGKQRAGENSKPGYMMQGNAPGQLASLPPGDFDAVLSSPPYESARIDGAGDEGSSGLRNPDGSFVRGPEGWEKRKEMGGRYGDTDGNLANLQPGDFDAAISSPPFQESSPDGGWQLLGKYAEEGRLTVDQVKGEKSKIYPSWQKDRATPYATDPANLGGLVPGDFDAAISSPPYVDSVGQRAGANDTDARIERMKAAGIDVTDPANIGGQHGVARQAQTYGDDPAQLGSMAAGSFDAAISSPPYAKP